VGVAVPPAGVVEGSGSLGGGEGGERLQVDGVGKAVVAGVTGQNEPFGARRPGYGRRAGIASCGSRRLVRRSGVTGRRGVNATAIFEVDKIRPSSGVGATRRTSSASPLVWAVSGAP